MNHDVADADQSAHQELAKHGVFTPIGMVAAMNLLLGIILGVLLTIGTAFMTDVFTTADVRRKRAITTS
jgi:capsular polysaccharide biosynthesis protein